jgi:hypothetical protein
MSSSFVAFNPNDPVQQQFLSSLALGETANSSYAATEGFGGVNLADAPTDQYGFPQWQGQGNSHAAGIFQFQPATWDALAQQYGLNFSDAGDQEAGAWYLAQQTYNTKTGGNLYGDLSTGNTSKLNSALASVWPSVSGNAASPHGLAAAIAGGDGANLPFPAARAPSPREIARLAHLNRVADYSALSRTGSNGSGSSRSEG